MKKKEHKLLIEAKLRVDSFLSGNHISIFKYDGYDFEKLREYESGDDTRKIDWISSAKLQKPYIKVYNETRELNIVVAVMLNGSMLFGSTELKKNLLLKIYSIITYSALTQKDRVSSFIFANKLYKEFYSIKNIYEIEKSIEYIDKFDSINKEASYKTMIDNLSNKIKDKSLIFILADFFDKDLDLSLLTQRHQVIPIIIRDRVEESPKDIGFNTLLDLESSKIFKGIFSNSIKNSYITKIKENDLAVNREFLKHRVKFTKIYSDEEPFIKLKKLFL
jgi:uncharacterized protein (DUF58 family)